MREEIKKKFPVTIHTGSRCSEDVIRDCLYFLDTEIVETIINIVSKQRHSKCLAFSADRLISDLFVWSKHPYKGDSYFWSNLCDSLWRNKALDTPIPEIYLFKGTKLNIRTITL